MMKLITVAIPRNLRPGKKPTTSTKKDKARFAVQRTPYRLDDPSATTVKLVRSHSGQQVKTDCDARWRRLNHKRRFVLLSSYFLRRASKSALSYYTTWCRIENILQHLKIEYTNGRNKLARGRSHVESAVTREPEPETTSSISLWMIIWIFFTNGIMLYLKRETCTRNWRNSLIFVQRIFL